YSVPCTGLHAVSRFAYTTLFRANVDRAPVVSAPVEVSGGENGVITVNVTASDPDGDAITSLSADLTGLPAGNHAVFTAGSGNTTGTLSWTPWFSDAGSYTVTFTASNALSGAGSTRITVNNGDRAPVVAAPTDVSGGENGLTNVNLTASDPDGDAITALSADLTGLPAGNHALFTPGSGNTIGSLNW